MPQLLNPQIDARSWAGLAALGAFWGSSFFFFEVALATLGQLSVACGRVGGATLTLAVFLTVVRQALPRDTKFWVSIGTMGVLNNALPFALIAGAQTQIDSGLASILNA